MLARMLPVVVLVLIASKPSGADQLTLTTGETLKGRITDRGEQSVTLEHPILGKLTIDRTHITALTEPADDEQAADEQASPEITAAGVPAVQPAQPDPAADTSIKSRLLRLLHDRNSQIELGLSGAEGNTQTTNARLAFVSNKEDDHIRSLFNTTYYWYKSDGHTSRNELKAELTHDWLKPETPWFLFVNGRYDLDQFQAWDHRVSGFGGVGYEFVKTDRFQLIGRLGAGLTKEFGGENDFRPEAMLGGSILKWKLTDHQTVTASTSLFPNLSELDRFRTITKLEWQILLSKADGVSLKFGLENEYESHVDSDDERNDVKYYGTLVIEF